MHRKIMPLAMIVGAVILVGCEGMDPVSSELNEEGNPLGPAAAPVIETELPLSGAGFSGSVTLTRSSQGLAADIEITAGLTSGYAYSVWWAIFDNPQGCDANGCDAFDLRNIRQAQGSLVNGGGFVAGGSPVFHQTELTRHDVEGKSVEAGDSSGVDNTYGAEVHLVIRSHGEAETDPADLMVQTGTFGVFCNLPDPPVVGGCQNVAAAMFTPPTAPGQAGS
jgi:hypothetical protein